jgi:hypothetical protein
MTKAKPLPDLDELRSLFLLDSDAPSFLRYVASDKAVTGRKTNGYYLASINGRRFPAHRIVWAIANGRLPPPEMQIDHSNGVRSDNRPENLRLCTSAENHQNMVVASRAAQGVAYRRHNKGRPWAARIAVNGKQLFLGYFRTPEEGHSAYLQAKQLLHPFNPNHRESL